MNPAYSTDNITWVNLLGAYRLGGKPRTRQQEVVPFETDNLKMFVYNNGTRRTWELHWRCTNTQLNSHDTMDQTVNGSVIPFYFSLIGDGSDSVLVRKQTGFDPTELDSPGGSSFMFDYILVITEEVA